MNMRVFFLVVIAAFSIATPSSAQIRVGALGGPTVADLSSDGHPEVIFGTFGENGGDGHLVILSNEGALLHDIELPDQNAGSGNGIGPAAAPTVGDLDNDGDLEILVLTIDHGLDVYTVEGSSCNCSPPGDTEGLYCGLSPTGRGNYLRNGRQPGT